MSTEKVEGAEKNCGKCKTPLICIKVVSEWNGKKSEKLQWQNKIDGTPHFYFAGPGKYNCSLPKTPEDVVMESMQTTSEVETETHTVNTTVKVSGPFDEAELIARWSGERAYKIVMAEVSDFSKLTQQEKSGLGQKEGMYTRLLADTVLELMKIHGIKSNYGADKDD